MKYILFVFLVCSMTIIYSAEYGICSKNFICVHKTANASSEQVTQLIFGDTYTILSKSKDKKWLLIENLFDKYQGWISKENHYAISEKSFIEMKNKIFPVCADLKGIIEFEGEKFEISLGSSLPYYKNGSIVINGKKGTFTGNAVTIPREFNSDILLSSSKLCLNIPYLWGGKNAFGYDCSGFVQTIYKTFGIFLPRDSGQQVKLGTDIKLTDAKIGDLAFFHENGKIVHVGIIIEGNKIIHASKKVKINKLDSTGIWVDETQSYSHYLKCIKRVIP
ncbi:MAG: NlpC/P60 family protein [Bacteroidota bacterium]